MYSYRGIPVPIPDAGIPLEVVETARQRLGENTAPSSAGDREWELSGGMMRCGECGRQMATHPTRRNKKVDFYYRCPKRHETGDCANGNSFRADVVEPLVWETVREATGNRELVLQQASEHFARLRRELPDPDLNTARLYKELEQVRMERKGYWKQNARGVPPDDELDELLAESDREIARLEEILETARSRKERLAFIERDEAEIKSAIERGDLDEVFEPNDDFDDDHVARERQWAYRQYRVRVGAYADDSLRVTWLGSRSVGGSELLLLPVPADAHAEDESPAGDEVQARNLLRGGDGVALDHQGDARADEQPLCSARRRGERDERVQGAVVLAGQVSATRIRGLPARRDVGVLGDEQRVEAALLYRPRERGRGYTFVGDECGDSEFHAGY